MPSSPPAAVSADSAAPRRPNAWVRWSVRLLVALALLLVTAFLAARFWVWPQLARLLNDEARLMALVEPALAPQGLRLSVRGAHAEWEGLLAPRLVLEEATLRNQDDEALLSIERAQAVFGPRSLFFLLDEWPVFSRLEVERLVLEAGPDSEGRLRLAGFLLEDGGPTDPALFDALSHQGVFRLGELQLRWRDRADRAEASEAAVNLRLRELALRISPSRLSLRSQGMDLSELSRFQQAARPGFGRLSLGGQLAALSVDWSGPVVSLADLAPTEILKTLSLEAQLQSVSASLTSGLRSDFSLQGLSGRLRLADGAGRLQLDDGPLSLAMPGFFSAGPLAFDRSRALVEWAVDDWQSDASGLPSGLRFDLQSLELENADLALRMRGSQQITGGQLGKTSLRGSVDRLDAGRAYAYLPSVVGRDARAWIQRAFVKAAPAQGDFLLEGRLSEFPFLDSSQGRFEANLRLTDLDLRFAPSWPLITRAAVDLAFEGPSLRLSSRSAEFGSVAVARIDGLISDLDADRPMLALQAGIDAPLDGMLKTVNESPVAAMLANFTQDARASGQATLGLDLQVDLSDPDESVVKGQLQFARNRLDLAGGIPTLSDLHGELAFSESGLTSLMVEGQALGGPLRLAQAASRTSTRLTAKGEFQGKVLEIWLAEAAGLPLKGALVGQSGYNLQLDIARRGVSLDVQSSLKGLAIRLPAPARKSTQTDWGLRLRMTQTPKPGTGRFQQWRLETTGHRLSGLLEQSLMIGGTGDLRGSVAIGEPASPPTRSGVVLSMISPSLDLERWLSALDRRLAPPSNTDVAGGPPQTRPGLTLVEIKTPVLLVGAQRVSSVVARAAQNAGVWSIDLQADQVAGRLVWRGRPESPVRGEARSDSQGVLVARLSKLWLSRANGTTLATPAPAALNGLEADDEFQPLPVTALSEARRWPSIDLVAEDFRRGSSRFGQLTLDAAPSSREPGWIIRQLEVQGSAARLEASGKWAAQPGTAAAGGRPAGSPPSETSLQVRLQVASGQGLLDQLGFGGLVKGTPGEVKGELAWDGAPTDFRPQALRGQLSLDLGEGQFLKADPGLAKLISVLNLQSLPSRISLDFRDIFSEGFAYQRVRGDVQFERGLAQTKNLRIVGVQASVFIDGQASLHKETQDIRVLVLPELNAGLASLGYALVNPAIGLGSFLAQYVLRDPLRKVLAYEYRVTGPWIDPVVSELPRRAPPELSAPQAPAQ